jgi:hypothetical protein
VTSSAIPAVKAALLTLLGSASGLEGVAILRGKPDPLPDEFVSVWDAASERDYAGLGPKAPLDEVIDLTLVVDVGQASGTDFEPSETRAWEIFGAVEDAIRSDLTLSGSWRFDRISKVKQEYFRQDKRRGCRVFCTLTGKARI